MTGLIDAQTQVRPINRLRVVAVLVAAAGALAVLQWGVMRASHPLGVGGISILLAASLLVALLVGFTSNRKAAVAILVAAAFWSFNEVLLQLDFVTFVNFGQFMAISAFGEFFPRFVAVSLLGIALMFSLEVRRRIWFYMVIILLLLGSIPSRWTDSFYI